MGYQTDFIGYLQIDPPLAERERDPINKIPGSPFLDDRSGGLHEATEDDEVLRQLTAGAPRGWSNWAVCDQGCCLSYDGGDKANHMVPWLKFLVATFFDPAASVDDPGLVDRNHVLTGMVVGSRRDTRELYAITARRSVIEVEMLWPGNPQWSSYPALAYQIEIDRFRDWVIERKARG